MRHSAWGTSASTFTKPSSASSTRGGAASGSVAESVAESVSVSGYGTTRRATFKARETSSGEASPTRGKPSKTSVGGSPRGPGSAGARAPD